MIAQLRFLFCCALFLLVGLVCPANAYAQIQGQGGTRDTAAKDLPLTAEQRQVYVGVYTTELPNGVKGTVRIFEERGALRLRPSDEDDARRLLYQGNHIFMAEKTPDFVLTFTVVNNRAMTFRVRKEDGEITGVRVPDLPTSR